MKTLILFNKERQMFKESNSFGDQIIQIEDYEDNKVKTIFRHEGDWLSMNELQKELNESVHIPVIITKKLKGE